MAAYSTSLTIQFGDDQSAVSGISAEVDSRDDGYNAGKTTFLAKSSTYAGDDAYILAYAPETAVLQAYTSIGTIQDMGSEYIEFEEVVAFIDGVASVSHPVSSLVSKTWIGANGGTITPVIGGTTLNSSPDVKVAVARVKYKAKVTVFKQSPPLIDTLGADGKVAIVLVGTTP